MIKLRSVMPRGCAAVGLSESSEIDFQLRLLALSEGDAVQWERNSR